jgi:hypothetical protein
MTFTETSTNQSITLEALINNTELTKKVQTHLYSDFLFVIVKN